MSITYSNFWPTFDPNNFWLQKLLLGHNFKKNIHVFSVFGDNFNITNSIDKNNINILYVFENFEHHYHTWVPNIFKSFDCILGVNNLTLENYIRIPAYVHEDISNFNYVNTPLRDTCLVATNPTKLRLIILDKFNLKKLKVDCPSSVGHNVSKISKSLEAKINFIKQYYFNICVENSYGIGYCTEKIYHSLMAGCIPIYWGDLSADEAYINKNKILEINKDLSNLDEIIDKVFFLLNNKKALQQLQNMQPFYLDNILAAKKDIYKKIVNFLQKL